MYNLAEVQGATWTSDWHLNWGPSCRTEPLTCRIWCYLFIDTVRIELNYRTPGLMTKNCLVVWWNPSCPNSEIASSDFFSLKVGILLRLFWCGLQGWDRSKWENNSICCTHDLIRENEENCVKMSLVLKSSKVALNDRIVRSLPLWIRLWPLEPSVFTDSSVLQSIWQGTESGQMHHLGKSRESGAKMNLLLIFGRI